MDDTGRNPYDLELWARLAEVERRLAQALEAMRRQQQQVAYLTQRAGDVATHIAPGDSAPILVITSAIAAGGTGTVTQYERGAWMVLGARTILARNPWPDPCPANRKAAVGVLNGVPNCLLWWSCNSA